MRNRRVSRLATIVCSLVLLPAWHLAEPHHLYVGAFITTTRHVMLRYALREGLPEKLPDLVITDFGFPAGIAPDGELYSEVGAATFFVFRPGATKPYRRFHINLHGGKYVSAPAVAPDGVFWAEYSYFTAGPARKPEVGALAFSPHARGDVFPIKVLSEGGSSSLAFNSRGDMFFDGFVAPNLAVVELKDVLEQPQVARAYVNSYIDDANANLAVNGYDDLFVQTANNSIAVFAPGADPTGPPSNVVQTTIKELPAIAAGPHYVYALDRTANRLDVFLGHKNGPQQPIASVELPYVSPHVLIAGP